MLLRKIVVVTGLTLLGATPLLAGLSRDMIQQRNGSSDPKELPPHVTKTALAVPSPVRFSLHSDALKTAIDELKEAKESSYKDVYLSYGNFITPAGDYFVAVQFYLPKPGELAPTRKATFFGTIEDASGAAVRSYEAPTVIQASHAALFSDQSLSLPAGRYTAYLGLATQGKPVTLTKTALELTPLDKDASGISPLILSDDIHALQVAAEPAAPFSFGGTKVIVKGDKTFTRKDELWFFYELLNPGFDTTTNAPTVLMKIDVEGTAGTQRIKMGVPMQDAGAEALSGVAGHYAVMHSIPLATFPAGDYSIKIKVVDKVKNVSYDLQQTFKVVAE